MLGVKGQRDENKEGWAWQKFAAIGISRGMKSVWVRQMEMIPFLSPAAPVCYRAWKRF